MGNVQTIGKSISIDGDFGEPELQIALAALYNLTNKVGLKDINIDFSRMTKAIAPEMLPFCAIMRKLLHEGVLASFVAPTEPVLRRLFSNTGWAKLD